MTRLGTALSAWRRWRVRLSTGILDQLTFSGANFVVNVLLARWLAPAGYGEFAIAFAVLLLLAGPHVALLVDPINVVGPRVFRGDTRRYLRSVATLHVAITFPLGALVAALAFWPGTALPALRPWLVAMGFTAPLFLSMWLLRGASYVDMRPGAALSGSAVYSVGLLSLTLWAHATSRLTPAVAFLCIGVASAIGSVWIAAAVGLLGRPARTSEMKTAAREHWAYGRWILGAAVAHGMASGLYVPLVGMLAGLEQTAVLRALQNLVVPLQQVLAGAGLVAYPFLSRQVAEHGRTYLVRRGPVFVFLHVAGASIYAIALAALGTAALDVLYGRGYYTAYARLVPLFAVTAIVAAAAQGLGILVRAIAQPSAVLWSKLASAAWLALAGIAMVRAWGATGAILGLGGGAAAEAIVLTLALRKRDVNPGRTAVPAEIP